jgi:hypothetical protein
MANTEDKRASAVDRSAAGRAADTDMEVLVGRQTQSAYPDTED